MNQINYRVAYMSNNFFIKKCKAKTPLGFEIGIEEGVYAVTGDEPDLSAVKLQGPHRYEIKHSEFQKLKLQKLAVMQS